MDGKIKIHLMMLITFTLCNASSMVLATSAVIRAEQKSGAAIETVLSAVAHSEQDETEILPSGKAANEALKLRGKRFEWLGNTDHGIAKEEPLDAFNHAPGIDALKVDELACN